MSNLQAVQDKIDNIKEKMSDGEYLELCNLMKDAFEADKKKDELIELFKKLIYCAADEEKVDEDDETLWSDDDEEDDDEEIDNEEQIRLNWKDYFSRYVLYQYNDRITINKLRNTKK